LNPAKAGATVLAPLVPLLAEVGDLKRVRTADADGSLAERLFRRSWSALVAGEDPKRVARRETAAAVAAARLGGVDAGILRRCGLDAVYTLDVLERGFDAAAGALPEPLRAELRGALGPERTDAANALPGFVGALARQPRAGCTRPGSPRLVLEPPESHADHCAAVAVCGVLLSESFGAQPATVFVAGLAHHLHNAVLPDSGFAGEELLGERLDGILDRLNGEALATLPRNLADAVRSSLELVGHAGSSEARAFNAADVLDRVLQMRHYARMAQFTMDQALDEMDLVHEGPLKDFHERVLAEAGLR
jgi:5'-deoxynucleotidase YfbR-like HD superfamily hydrolase